MESYSAGEAEKEFERARQALAEDNSLEALSHLEKALRVTDNPNWYSFLGYCIARERGQVRKGIDLCLVSMDAERLNPDHYLNLGKIYLISGNKEEAVRLFREGMAHGGNADLANKLIELGTRKPPVISFLPRDNFVNRYLGFVFSRLGLR